MADTNLNPFLLAANVPHPDARLLPLLRATAGLASQQDEHGYSLLHAAASYDHVDLLRQLVQEFHVDVNLVDEDGETCLFVAETAEVAKCLVEELQVDVSIRNHDGQTASDKILEEGDYPEVGTYLQSRQSHEASAGESVSQPSSHDGLSHPPPLPPNMNISFDAISEDQLNGAVSEPPDPVFRRRIEELAAKENFNTDEGQRELRELITDAVRGVGGDDRDVRRRVG